MKERSEGGEGERMCLLSLQLPTHPTSQHTNTKQTTTTPQSKMNQDTSGDDLKGERGEEQSTGGIYEEERRKRRR